jgi:hypothetical protein
MKVNPTGCTITCTGYSQNKQCTCEGTNCSNGVWLNNGAIYINKNMEEVSCNDLPAIECTTTVGNGCHQ